mmetsp:Transcript_17101/g.49421  ORF Transcript_17101/g.49421 Transcript_17101/m.49421 type:complete len:483 (-) Transcript_17101:56-1504(-)
MAEEKKEDQDVPVAPVSLLSTSGNRKRKAEHHAGAAEALRLAVGTDKKYDSITRHRTEVERAVIDREEQAEEIIESLPKDSSAVPRVELYLPDILRDTVFVGHLVTDLDSVAGAIGAAELYGGIPALASEVNSETAFALEKFGVEKPRTIEDILKENPEVDICLVDHQQTSQMNPLISPDRIVGVIDHHALQSKTIVTEKPIYIDIRPWGSMSTIIAHTFVTHGRRPAKHIAGMLLCAILSDTLNLLGPTTTDWDRLMVAVLAEIATVDDIQYLASQQFKAKSRELAHMSAVDLVNGDQKSFSFAASGFKGEVGFGVVETTDDDIIMDRASELLPEMVACKKEKSYDCLFLAVVNIVKLRSKLLICGPTELALAKDAFGGGLMEDCTVMDLGGRVSRKKDYIPVLTRTIKNGWTKPSGVHRGPSQVELSELGHLEVDPVDPYGNVKRTGSVLQGKKGISFSLKEGEKAGDAEESNEDAPTID